jgi:hypothetical protein
MLFRMPLAPDAITELPDRMTVSPATALRYLRKGVTLPDGRQIEGHAPGVAGATLPDHELRDELARQLNGMTEAVLPYGRADVLTKSSGVRGRDLPRLAQRSQSGPGVLETVRAASGARAVRADPP